MKRIGFIDGRRIKFLDTHPLYFGTDDDFAIAAINGDTLRLTPSASGKCFQYGANALGVSIYFWTDTGGDYMFWDAVNKELSLFDSDIILGYDDYLYLGESKEFGMHADSGGNVWFRAETPPGQLSFGESGFGQNVNIWTTTPGDYVSFDAANKLFSFNDVYPVLTPTDTPSDVEGAIWYNRATDKLNFRTAIAVEAVNSS